MFHTYILCQLLFQFGHRSAHNIVTGSGNVQHGFVNVGFQY